MNVGSNKILGANYENYLNTNQNFTLLLYFLAYEGNHNYTIYYCDFE